MIIHNASITDANNVRILDAIRNQGSLDYQRRIPSATQAGVDSVLRNLTDYRPRGTNLSLRSLIVSA